jgi:hypothetical protein
LLCTLHSCEQPRTTARSTAADVHHLIGWVFVEANASLIRLNTLLPKKGLGPREADSGEGWLLVITMAWLRGWFIPCCA